MSTKTERYCAECRNPEYDENGYSHDYEPYDHDFERDYTMEDAKNFFDTATSFVNTLKTIRDVVQPKPQQNPQLFSTIFQKDSDAHSKLDSIQNSINYGKKIERKRWIVGVSIGAISVAIGIILAI